MHNNRLPDSEHTLLAAAAHKAEISPSRVDILRPRPGTSEAEPPLFLLAGLAPGMDLLLHELSPFNEQIARSSPASPNAASATGPTPPVIIGADAAAIAPRVGTWTLHPGSVPASGALVAIRAHPDFTAQSHAAIASFPRFERGLLVTQTSQPLGIPERQLLRLMAAHCVEVGVIYLCYRGDEIDDTQLAELRTFAAREASKAGVSLAGYQDSVLYILKNKNATNVDILAQFRFAQPVTEQAEADFIYKARKELIQELLQKLPDSSQKEITLKDKEGIKERFQRYLSSLGDRLPQLVRKKNCATTSDIRRLYITEMDDWQNKASIEGSTMHHLETLSPGTIEEFKKQIRITSDNLELILPPKPLSHHLRRYAIPLPLITAIWGFLAGCLAAWYYFHYMGSFKDEARALLLQAAPWLAMGLLISMYLYMHGRTILKASPPGLQDENSAMVEGWASVKNQMLAWLENHLATPAQDLKKDIYKLRSHP